MKLPGVTVSLSLESLLRIFQNRRAEHLDRVSDYLTDVAEQSERIAASWKNIATAIQLELNADDGTVTKKRMLPDFLPG